MASRLNLDVLVNVKGADQLEGIGNKLQRTGFALSKYVTVPLIAAGGAAFKFASDADEASSKASRVFGDAFGDISKDAQDLNDAFSEAQFLDAAGTFGQMAQSMGFTAEESANLSKEWLGMAQDFASFNNLDIEETLTAIRAGISGEFEPLKRMGVLINQATLEAKALELGLWDGSEALDAHAKAAATTALITEQMGAAQGDFAATADGAANSSRILAGNMVDLAAELGTQLLPIGIQILTWAKGLFTAFAGLPQPVKDLIVPIAALVAAIGPVLFIGGKLISSFKQIIVVFNLLKVALLTNPFTALAVAVALIAALIILNWDKIWAFLKDVWGKITNALGTFAKFFSDTWESLTRITEEIWNGIGNIIKGAINGLIDIINGFFGFLNGLSFGAGPWDIGPIHVDAISIDPFNIPLIPHLASGGIVDSPTLALLGERGREAVIPLDRIPSLGGGNSYTFNVEGRIEDAEELVDIFERSQRLNRALAG